MEVETIITLVVGILASLGILTALLKVLSEIRNFMSGLIAAAEDGKITNEEFRQAAQNWARITAASVGFWKAILKVFGKG